MRANIQIKLLVFFLIVSPLTLFPQDKSDHLLSTSELDTLLLKPLCLKEYIPNQSGPLYRIGTDDNEPDDSTFTVEHILVPSEDILINGWLYLPLGEGQYPLIILTNGGGDGTRPIRSLSDWIAPILAHCGYAAFVHDKRGTGESGGIYKITTYNDYVTDAGNCAIYLATHKNIDSSRIGIMGGSEGGRVAVLAASRFPVIKYVISYAGTVVSTEEDRLYATLGGLKSSGVSDSLIDIVKPLWIRSFAAWASNDSSEHNKVDREIIEWRKLYDEEILPSTKKEMDSLPFLELLLPTWYSMPNDYMKEMEYFRKKWLAIFGKDDIVVPTKASVENIQFYMELSKNEEYSIAVIPKCGHTPINTETKRMVRLDNIIINWLNENIQ